MKKKPIWCAKNREDTARFASEGQINTATLDSKHTHTRCKSINILLHTHI